MTRAAALALVLTAAVACREDHEVTIELGSGSETSSGYTCGHTYARDFFCMKSDPHVQVVTEVLTLGDTLLGCRTDDLADGCAGGQCKVVARACTSVPIHEGLTGTVRPGDSDAGFTETVAAIAADVRAQLTAGDMSILPAAPDGPVLVRVLMTTESCAAIVNPDSALAAGNVIGCGYSCPVILDDVDTIRVAADGLLSTMLGCNVVVDACAAFPGSAADDPQPTDPVCPTR